MDLLEFISETFSVDKAVLKLETAPGDFPEWDSLGHLSLLTSLEEKFSISFDVGLSSFVFKLLCICR